MRVLFIGGTGSISSASTELAARRDSLIQCPGRPRDLIKKQVTRALF
jgi:hypothetical protein